MRSLLLPHTDLGVIAQVIVVAAILALSLRWTWRQPDRRLFVVGVGIVAVALMGLRAAH